jgi:cytochrome c oxidase subunit IV
MTAHAHEHGEDGHAHPTPGTYTRVALLLFVLTALEVGAYEVGHRQTAPLHSLVQPIVVPILLVLSAIKFAMVAGFYMHLKQDSKLFTHLFVWPIIIAALVIVSLIVLFAYWIRMTF